MKNKLIIQTIGLASVITAGNAIAQEKPNVILIMTDDQGYGDMSAHGNPVLKTPEMDKLRTQSVRFTDFHVASKCTPTRGQLMTGLDAMRNGATRVCQGLSLARNEHKMMPKYFAESGYATGMFGKWHLGDSYPHPPRFRGFQEVVSFRAWGITSLADYWGNKYYDPTLMHNGVDKKYKGYCTDIFFDEAMAWMKKCKDEKKPFFAYIPTNTPHAPDDHPKELAAPYKGKYKGIKMHTGYYSQIANIDENIGRLEVFLKESGLRDNTILLFLSDNGTRSASAMKIFNAGMNNKKGSNQEGGHRVHLFVRWVDGKLQHGKDISELTIVQDLLPTLVDLCGLKGDVSNLDGVSIAGLLKGRQKKLEERICVSQFGETCKKWDHAVVMKDKWRLLKHRNTLKLYDVAKDPHQDKDVSKQFPEITKQLSGHYDKWYKEAYSQWKKTRYLIIGTDHQNPMTLYANDWIGEYCDTRHDLINKKAKGFWNLIVDRDGDYEIELRRWPEESGKPMTEGYRANKKLGALPIAKAQLIVADFDNTVGINPKDALAKFSVSLKKGKTKLTANLLDNEEKIICCAPYVKVTRK